MEDTRRIWPTESIKQGSQTEAASQGLQWSVPGPLRICSDCQSGVFVGLLTVGAVCLTLLSVLGTFFLQLGGLVQCPYEGFCLSY